MQRLEVLNFDRRMELAGFDVLEGGLATIVPVDVVHSIDVAFFDEKILSLYCEAVCDAKQNLRSFDLKSQVILDDLSLDFEKLGASFCAPLSDQCPKNYLLDRIELIQTVDAAYMLWRDRPRALWSKLETNLKWMGEKWLGFLKETILLQLESFEDLNLDLFRILVLSSGLEQSLGNLVLAKKKSVSPLFNNMLLELADAKLIDHRLSHLLKLIVGPPWFFNVRNLLWHGFLEPELIGSQYWHFLLCLVVSIGRSLSPEVLEEIRPRALHNFDEYEAKIKDECGDLECQFQLDNLVISSRLQRFWKMFLVLAENNSKVVRELSYCLLFPLLEAALRYLFCLVNQVPFTYLSAMMEEYYVTFEDIFDYLLDGQRFLGDSRLRLNRLYRVLPHEVMLAGLDILLLPEGVRFRDRLGHGQVDYGAINEKVGKYVRKFVAQVLRCCSKTIVTSVELPKKSLFHGTSLFQTAIEVCLTTVVRIEANIPEKVNDSVLVAWEIDLDRFRASVRHLTQPVIYHNATCEELITSARATLSNIEVTLVNIEMFLIQKLEAASKRELRHRQRIILEAFLKDLPQLLQALLEIIFSFCRLWVNLELEVASYKDQKETRRRKARYMLKWAQNMATKSRSDKNEWASVLDLATTMIARV